MNKIKLARKIRQFKTNAKPRNPIMKKEKSDIVNNEITLLKGRQMAYNSFESRVFPLPNRSLARPETWNSSELLTSSEKSSSPEHSSYYCEYISPEERYQREDSN